MGTPTAPRTRGVPRWVGLALLVVATVFLLRAAKLVLLPVTLAVLLTFVLAPAVRRLRDLGLPAPAGAGLVLVSLVAALLLFGSTLVTPAATWWERAPANLQQLMEALERLRAALFGNGQPAAPAASPLDDAQLQEQLRHEGMALTRVVLGQFWYFVVCAAATVILLFFLLCTEYHLVWRTMLAIGRPRVRALVLSGIREAQRDIGRFLTTMTLLNIGLGIGTGLVLHAIGLPNPILWGTLAALLNFVFYIGPVLMAVLLLMAGITTFDHAGLMLAPALAYLALNALESNLVGPWLMGRRLRLNPVFVFLSVLLWGWIWGMAGALIAVPMLLALRTVCRRVPRLRVLCGFINEVDTPPQPFGPLLARRPPR